MDCFRPLKDSPKFKWELNRNLIHVGSRKTRRTDMAKAATSKPKPFLATVTPVEISKGDTVSGVRFTKMAGATVARKGVKAMTRTVMAFGRANAAVARSLKRSEEHTSELQSLMRNSYAVFCLENNTPNYQQKQSNTHSLK